MGDPDSLAVGQTLTHERTFTVEDVETFATLSGDEGAQHAAEMDPPVVHGLLTATLPTKIGGDIDYVARTMDFEFPNPLFVGQAATCEVEIVELAHDADRARMTATFETTTENGQTVMRGDSSGVVFETNPWEA